MTQINPDVAKLQIDLKEALAKLDKHMRHGQCDEEAFHLANNVTHRARELETAIGADSIHR